MAKQICMYRDSFSIVTPSLKIRDSTLKKNIFSWTGDNKIENVFLQKKTLHCSTRNTDNFKSLS